MGQVKELFDLNIFDLVFVLSATAFNLLIAGVFLAQKRGRSSLVRKLGILLLSLGIPLAAVFIHYLREGRALWVMLYFVFIFLYLLVELLLDFILKIDFRASPRTHIPYIILEYIALFGLIGIAFAIDRTWGWIVSFAFWILLGSLIYLYVGRRKQVGA